MANLLRPPLVDEIELQGTRDVWCLHLFFWRNCLEPRNREGALRRQRQYPGSYEPRPASPKR